MFSQFARISGSALAVLALVLLGSLAANSDATAAEEEKIKLDFRAFAVDESNAAGRAGVLEIHISRWSTEAEHQQLFQSLVDKGQKQLVKELQHQKETGWIRFESEAERFRTFPSTRLRYAREMPQGDQKEIVLVTDRPLGFLEVAREDRSVDYSVSIIVLKLAKDEQGKWKGKGEMAVGVKLKYNQEKKQLEVENYSSQPVRLSDVTQH